MMRSMAHWMLRGLVVMMAGVLWVTAGYAQLKTGEVAPLFALKDISGNQYDLSDMKEQPMVVVYFFDVGSKSSQEGLLHLDELAKKYKQNDLIVWGVTRSAKNDVSAFVKEKGLTFPVLLDNGKISDLYQARLVLPTVCIVGPDLKMMDYFQGGGKATETLLVTLAERELQRRNTEVAKALSEKVTATDPRNSRAQSVKGYAELKEGDIKAAEKTFYSMSRGQGESEILGKEGLTQVYAQKGEPEKAMKIAREVEAKSGGERAYTHVVKGDLLYSQNKPAEAEKEYRKAIDKDGGDTVHRAVAFNQLGRIYATNGKYEQSRKMYDEAVTLDPYFVEATSNKGLTYERQGEWAKALESYRRAKALNRNDPFAVALAAHAQEMMLLEQDPDLKRQFEQRIQSYVQRFKEGTRATPENTEDPWTSGTTVLAMFEPTETGGLAKRDGFGRVLNLYISGSMKSSGRVEIIEPIMVERVVKALGLTRKDLQDPATVKRLAHAFGARLMVKGSLFHLSDSTMLKLKLEDVARGDTAEIIERQFASAVTLKKDLHWLNREILTAIMTHYPLQAFVVQVTGAQVLLNLGKSQGVVQGSVFDVVEEKPMVSFKGKQFKPEPSVMATVEVVKVEDDFAYALIKDTRRPVKAEDRLRESVRQMVDDDQKIW